MTEEKTSGVELKESMFIENRINETKKFVFIHDRQSKGKRKD